jgi:hypothetical protein
MAVEMYSYVETTKGICNLKYSSDLTLKPLNLIYIPVGVLMFFSERKILLLIPLKTNTKLIHVLRFNSYRTVNTFSIGYQNQEVSAYREIIAVCSESHPNHKYALCEYEVQILGTKHSGTDSNH